jgi:predicted metal-dependent phosphoesterase TrpH
MDGAELDACWEGCGYHFLAFGMDPADARLRELCQELERQFETDFERILPRLTERYGLTREAFADKLGAYYRTHPAPRLNRFFAQELLLERGVFPDAAAMRNEIDALSNQAPALPGPAPAAVSVERVRDIVHAAGGILLVAHPTKYGRRGQWDRQRELIHAMLDLGLDGFELYHPAAVAEPHFAELEAEARRLKCAVSGGSDGHCDPHPRSPLPPGFRCPAWVMETVEAALAARRGCSAARCRCPSDSDSRAEVPS